MHTHTGRQRYSGIGGQASIHPHIHTCIHSNSQEVWQADRHTESKTEANRRPPTPTNVYWQEYIIHTYRETYANMDTHIHTYRLPDGQILIKADRGRHDVTQTNMHTYIRAHTLAYIHIHPYHV